MSIAMPDPTLLAGAPPYNSWGDVPGGEQTLLRTLRDEWEGLVGYTIPVTDGQLLAMANQGAVTLADVGAYMHDHAGDAGNQVLVRMPWASYGLSKDEYQAYSETFSTTYKKLTGQDITAQALRNAFRNPRDLTSGLLSASQYAQQLMNDVNIQKSFGWIKYGLDYEQWTQQKLSMRTAFGRDIQDAEAATMLQYDTASRGGNLSVSAAPPRQQSQQQQPGMPASVVR